MYDNNNKGSTNQNSFHNTKITHSKKIKIPVSSNYHKKERQYKSNYHKKERQYKILG